ncbi:hypothetical protein [Thalassobacter stenotrophicus]|uniref:Uncharacterized protein n=2 Tax=Thalassobacter stenotrophicus TaxID=266809 RepID=A0A0P1FGR1_9RHOB|nr:hypothetical protein [Thalassobacter stenotrophicus]CUH60230.1 hypothetical protein THS5294_01519 [Thalassobacter stenotrophicus]SHI70766.1 hypothetical protein SAMN02744035_01311 [Thalassobacter stenotrophicus DSM 16310]
MTREATQGYLAAIESGDLLPAIFFEGEFASGWVRLWTGPHDIEWNDHIWTGAGALIGLGALEETSEVVASGTTVSLSGVPMNLIGLAIEEARQGKPGRIWLAMLTPDREVIANPVQAFSGRLDVPEISEDGASCTITISYESRLIDLGTARSWRYTHESQQVLHPGDRGFEHVTSIQDKEITWGRG